MLPAVKRVLNNSEGYQPLLQLLSDVFITSSELASHWRYTHTHLCNLRKRNAGVPHIKLASGGVRYRLSDVIAAEIEGTSGPMTVERMCLALAACKDLSAQDRATAQAHIRMVLEEDRTKLRKRPTDW